jgi:hypothetical protein
VEGNRHSEAATLGSIADTKISSSVVDVCKHLLGVCIVSTAYCNVSSENKSLCLLTESSLASRWT